MDSGDDSSRIGPGSSATWRMMWLVLETAFGHQPLLCKQGTENLTASSAADPPTDDRVTQHR